jgi:hypothetical protein
MAPGQADEALQDFASSPASRAQLDTSMAANTVHEWLMKRSGLHRPSATM